MIETERLIVRPWRESDRDEYLASCNSEAVTAFLGGTAKVEDIDAGIARIAKSQDEHGFSFWAVERKSDGRFLGYCGLKLANLPGTPVEKDVEIGWRLREDAWGQGYAKEAAAASLDLAFGRFEAPQVVAVTALGNVPSQGLMKRLGMVRREELDFVDQRFPADSEVNPQVVFTIDAAAWRSARQATLTTSR